ncbi:hypothetical protein B0H13DRAFT_2265561 [Mycena leptocephala]|nr:hypothetical protein B0H13DRAFT_2265561 [Mycena leptocephala]
MVMARRTHSECPHIALKRLYHTGELLAPWSLHAPSCRYLNAWKPRGTRAWNKAARAHECIGFGLNAIVLVQSRSIGGDPKGHLDVEGSLGSKIAKLGERGSSGRYGRAVRMGIALALIHHQFISSSPPGPQGEARYLVVVLGLTETVIWWDPNQNAPVEYRLYYYRLSRHLNSFVDNVTAPEFRVTLARDSQRYIQSRRKQVESTKGIFQLSSNGLNSHKKEYFNQFGSHP